MSTARVARSVPALAWVRLPRQLRSQRTLDRILDAATALLDEKSFDEISVAEIVARAGSSVGSFYARFADKDCLLKCLQERLYADSLATADEALAPERWRGVPLPALVAGVIGFLVQSYVEQRGVRRAILARMAVSADFRERAARLARETTRRLTALLEERRGELRAGDLAIRVDVCHRMVYAALDQRIIFGELPPAGRRLGDAVLARELTEACLAYLGATPPPRAPARRRLRRITSR